MIVSEDAPAKVNLWLRVGPLAADGFHPLATLFCALELADTVEVTTDPADGPGLDLGFAEPLTATPDLGDPAANLAIRAARGFMEAASLPQSAAPRIRLIKRIPAGGGLGGGSSDAAAVLRAMARAHADAVQDDELAALAARLGSDVPFFLPGKPLALGTGRGERLTAVDRLPRRAVVLVLPEFGVATADAYRWLDADRGGRAPALVDPTPPESWDDVEAGAVNDIEGPVFARHPDLRRIRDALRDLGARPALLAGSGSSVFGVFEHRERAEEAATRLRSRGMGRVVVTAVRGAER
jgi:4-diphosphocytidyl-2-C-methyl-D-erythritol kinase